MTRNLLVCALLAALVLAVFGRVTGAGFVAYDDDFYVTQNPVALGGLSADGVRWVLTHEHGGYWAPLTALSHMLDVEIHGTEPAGHHATSLVLHVADTLLLFAFLAWTTRRTWTAALVAALFAVHPLHVEPVAWISSRKDVLSTLFAFGALITHAAWVRRGGAGLWLATTLLYVLGLAAKPMLVVLPFVLLCIDVWPLERPGALTARGFARLVAEKLPWLALGAVAIVATWFFLRESDSLFPFELTLADRVANAVVSYARYLGKTVWPADLSAIYPHPNLPGSTPWSTAQVAGAAALLAALTVGALATRRRAVIVGWAWFAGTLLPVSGIVAFGLNAMADRFTYVPLVGLFAALAYGGDDLVRGLTARGSSSARPAASALALAAVAACAVVSFVRVAVWHDSVALFEDAVAKAPRSPIPRNNLGNALAEQGRLDEAERQYRLAAQNAPGHAAAWINLGNLELSRDREEALAYYRKALAVDPDSEAAARNAGSVLSQLGRPEEAVEVYRVLVARRGERADLLQILGAAQREAGDRDGARASWSRAVELDPGNARAHCGLGLLLIERGEPGTALVHFERAIEADASLSEAHAWRGVAQEQLGLHADAVASFEASLAITPAWTLPLTRLAWLRATAAEPELRDPAAALLLAQQAVSATARRDALALDALAAAQAASGAFAAAVTTVQEALAARGDPALAAGLRERLELYRGGRPYVAR